eukprot:447678-Alexandrium_andersonii.AAC.1
MRARATPPPLFYAPWPCRDPSQHTFSRQRTNKHRRTEFKVEVRSRSELALRTCGASPPDPTLWAQRRA